MKISKRNVPLIMVGVLLPVIVYADAAVPNPKLMFENSNIVGIDNAVNAYSVPISNSKGVISYYDLAIDFTPNANGSVPTTANVTFVPSPVVSAKAWSRVITMIRRPQVLARLPMPPYKLAGQNHCLIALMTMAIH